MVKSAGTKNHWRKIMKSNTLRQMWALFAGALIFAAGSTARAQDAGGCVNDVDCPDKTCGGQVCDWTQSPMACRAPDATKKGMDGWCTTSDDCKCKGMGATCKTNYCTFTLPSQATGGGAGGGTGAGGSATTGTGGGTTAPAASSDSGGCSMSTKTATGLGSAGVLVGLGAIAFGIRRRRRAA
jgi:hypothetical protein